MNLVEERWEEQSGLSESCLWWLHTSCWTVSALPCGPSKYPHCQKPVSSADSSLSLKQLQVGLNNGKYYHRSIITWGLLYSS